MHRVPTMGTPLTSSSFPLVCAEGEERKTRAVLEVADLEILETVTQRHRFLDLRTYNLDGLIPIAAARPPEMSSLGRMEHPVGSRHLETPSKADPPIDTNPSLNVTDMRPVQSSNVELPIDATLVGMVRDEIHRQ